MPHVKVVASCRIDGGKMSVPEREAFIRAASKFADGDYTLILMQPGDQRTTQQNARYWSRLIKAFCEHTGYTSYEAHNILKGMFLEYRTTGCDHVGMEIIGDVAMGDSTTQLCTACFGLYMDDIEAWLGSEFGIVPKEGRAA